MTVVSVQWFGSEALDLTDKDQAGKLGGALLYRHDEPRGEIAEKQCRWFLKLLQEHSGHLHRGPEHKLKDFLIDLGRGSASILGSEPAFP